jgi:type I restriction enzyme S subunit
MSEVAKQDWRKTNLGALATKLVNGGTPPTDVPQFWQGRYPWITGADFTDSGIGPIRRFVSDDAISQTATNLINRGQLLIVTRTGVGKLAIAPTDIAISQDITGFYIDGEQATADFLYHRLKLGLEDLKKLNQGTSINGITRGDLVGYSLEIPPIRQQRRIATILTTLDEVIEATEKLVEKHQQIKAGLMHDLFTRGLWTRPELARSDHQGTPAEATAQEGQIRPSSKEAPGLYQDSPLGLVPKEWEVDRAGNLLARIEQGWSPDCESVPPEGEEWGVLKTSAVVWDGFEPRESKRLPSHLWPRAEYKVSKGDVLMTRAGPNSRVGVVALVDSSEGNLMISDKIYRCVPNDRIEPEFLVLALTSEGTQHVLEGYKTGLAESQTNISQAIVRKLWIPLPKTDERTLICKLAATVTNQLRATTTHLAKLRQQKQGLMHDLLTGRVRVE